MGRMAQPHRATPSAGFDVYLTTSRRQYGVQPSPPAVLPSSHCSFGCLTPSPQYSSWQLALQPSLSSVLPSSHSSPEGACVMSSPQYSVLQV